MKLLVLAASHGGLRAVLGCRSRHLPKPCSEQVVFIYPWLTFRPKLYFFILGPKMTPKN